MLPEDEILKDHNELLNLLDNALSRTKESEIRSKNQLLQLQETYSSLLFSITLGRKSSSEKNEVLSRMAELKQSIKDYPLIYTEIDAEYLRLGKMKREACSLAKKRERYNEVKRILLDSSGMGCSYHEELYLLAAPHYLNCKSDADEFLAGFDGDAAA